MGDNGLQLVSRKSGEGGDREHHDGTKPYEDRGRLQPHVLAVADNTVDAQSPLQGKADLEHGSGHGGEAHATLMLDLQEATGRSETERHYSDKPCFDQPAEGVGR